MTGPVKPSPPRSTSRTTTAENTARFAGSMRGRSPTTSSPSGSPSWPPGCPRRRSPDSSPAAVSGSTTSGGVVGVAAHPAQAREVLERRGDPCGARPSTIAVAAGTTSAAVPPYCRSKEPIGPFVLSVPAGTTSTTGARSRFTPAPCQLAPQRRRPARSSSVGGQVALLGGAGQAVEAVALEGLHAAALLVDGDPQPRARCCAPASRRSGAASSSADAVGRPARNMPPTPCAGQLGAAVGVVGRDADDEQLRDAGAPVQPVQRGGHLRLRVPHPARGWRAPERATGEVEVEAASRRSLAPVPEVLGPESVPHPASPQRTASRTAATRRAVGRMALLASAPAGGGRAVHRAPSASLPCTGRRRRARSASAGLAPAPSPA